MLVHYCFPNFPYVMTVTFKSRLEYTNLQATTDWTSKIGYADKFTPICNLTQRNSGQTTATSTSQEPNKVEYFKFATLAVFGKSNPKLSSLFITREMWLTKCWISILGLRASFMSSAHLSNTMSTCLFWNWDFVDMPWIGRWSCKLLLLLKVISTALVYYRWA